jgi:hypothetical protein
MVNKKVFDIQLGTLLEIAMSVGLLLRNLMARSQFYQGTLAKRDLLHTIKMVSGNEIAMVILGSSILI